MLISYLNSVTGKLADVFLQKCNFEISTTLQVIHHTNGEIIMLVFELLIFSTTRYTRANMS